jgi:adenosylcobyric acid synthase
VSLSFSHDPVELSRADWLVLPGSKHTRADLAWLRASGLDALVLAHAAAGKPLLAVCGGMQLIGQRIDDPLGQEGGIGGSEAGLGLLPLSTRFADTKRLARARHRFTQLEGPWSALSGREVEGYEIHQGRSESLSPALRVALPGTSSLPPLGWQHGAVLAVYLHGLFENPAVVRALFGAGTRSLDQVFDGLAAQVEASFESGFLFNLLEKQ